MPKKHTEEAIAAARALCAEGMSLPQIAARTAIPPSTLRYHLKAERAALGLPARPRPHRRAMRKAARPMLIARLWATAARQAAEIENRLAEAGGDAAALERDARTLAVLARTLRDLSALDAATQKQPEAADAASEIPRDPDALRRALAARLVELGRLERDD